MSAAPGTWTLADATVLALGNPYDLSSWPILGGDFFGDGFGDVAMAEPDASWGTRFEAGVTTIAWGW